MNIDKEYNEAIERQSKDPHLHERLKVNRKPMRHILYSAGDRPRPQSKENKRKADETWERCYGKKKKNKK